MRLVQSNMRPSYGTIALSGMILATCLAQSLVGWERVIAMYGFVPSATWSSHTWFSHLPGQAIPVVLTWIAYVFPHTGWGHVAGTMFGITLFGWGVERELGTRKYGLVVLLLVVSGVFALALVNPRGDAPMGGGSLLGFGLMGIWLAIFYKPTWREFPRVTLALEIAAVAGVACWLVLRTTPSEPSLFLALMWHALPLMLGWLGYRAAVTVLGSVKAGGV